MAGIATEFKNGQRLMKELKEIDAKLSTGESVSKAHLDSILSQLRNVGATALLLNIQGMGKKFNERILKVVDKVDWDIHDPALFTIEGDSITRKIAEGVPTKHWWNIFG
jgi:hypothetical protein